MYSEIMPVILDRELCNAGHGVWCSATDTICASLASCSVQAELVCRL
jgi:hypothetical protein